MANLWPRILPPSVAQDSRRRAEVRVYNKLHDKLDDGFTVFYSRPWFGIDEHGEERDGECDFLVAHPDYGMLAIEVKGGVISYDPETERWLSKDRNGFSHRIKNPVAQAKSAKHRILKSLQESPRYPYRRIHVAHGLVFPDGSAPPGKLGPDIPERIVCDSKKFRRHFRGWIAERLSEAKLPETCEPLGRDGILALERLLAKPFTFRFCIGAALAEADEAFRILEPTQFHILDTIAEIPRALIRGGAGTGKTVIAMEEAVRSAKEGERTLLTCHSRPLAENLERKLKDVENLTVAGFHSLCRDMANQAGISMSNSDGKDHFYDVELPNALVNAMDKKKHLMWDTVVVDEGQDFHSDWWLAIDACVKEEGKLRVLMDSNQKIYDKPEISVLEIDAIPHRLSRNLRNTKNIHKVSMAHYSGHEIVADGPDGREVDWNEVESIDKISVAHNRLQKIIFNEEVDPGEVAILCDDSSVMEKFLDSARGTTLSFTSAEAMALEDVVVDTVARFKGLERPVVIYIVGDNKEPRRELAYVAFSRARAYLCVICTDRQKRWLSGNDEMDED